MMEKWGECAGAVRQFEARKDRATSLVIAHDPRKDLDICYKSGRTADALAVRPFPAIVSLNSREIHRARPKGCCPTAH